MMITCSTGLAWIATKCAMLTCLSALAELLDVLLPSSELLPQAATSTTAAATIDPTMTRLMGLSSPKFA